MYYVYHIVHKLKINNILHNIILEYNSYIRIIVLEVCVWKRYKILIFRFNHFKFTLHYW